MNNRIDHIIETVTENSRLVTKKLEDRFIRYSVNQGSIRVPWHKREEHLSFGFMEETKEIGGFELPSNLGQYGDNIHYLARLDEIEMVET